jgi:primosomal protein N' (replication factor Y)
VRVVVERGLDEKSGIEGLTYGTDAGDIAVGERVEVPLGSGNRATGGVVVAVGGKELLEGLAAGKVKRILDRSGVKLPEELVELARWVAGYTVTPLGVVLATMMPAAVKRGVGRRSEMRFSPTGNPDAKVLAGLSPKLKAAWEALVARSGSDFPMVQAELAVLLDGAGVRGGWCLRRFAALGLLESSERTVVKARGTSGLLEGDERRAAEPELTVAQREVVKGIGSGVGTFGVHLLRGVTGSGKTEVYLRLIGQVLDRGEGAIVLVPEIALTPQVEQWFRARLSSRGVGVSVMHSGLSASQRNAEWERVAGGEARVVVGPRSAVFAPMAGLGLIVVDEEHDGSYKHEQSPRYNARDVAIKRGQVEECPVVLGSATPSMESWWNATEGGGEGEESRPRYRLWTLRDRVGGGRLPSVTVVDMAEERRALALEGADVGKRMLGPTLAGAIEGTLREGGQAILLLNRRGYASHLSCGAASCGWVMRCDHCDSGMVFHKDARLPKGGLVRCHHCLAEQLLPQACPACGRGIGLMGAGTQRIEEELTGLFGASLGLAEGRTFLRVDSDTMATAKDYAEALSRFGSGELRLLLGTQMIAKGLDFPNVRLVGVVSADVGLSMPDFRAGERAFQLVSQVAGRAGRGEAAGRVVVQTYEPTNPAIVRAAGHDYEGFAAEEIGLRKQAGLPPSVRMARVVCRDTDAMEARTRATDVAARLKGNRELTVVGPMEAPIAKIATYYRWAVEVYAGSAGVLQRGLNELRRAGVLKSDSQTAVDVDPMMMM